jgi:hypothetical protein
MPLSRSLSRLHLCALLLLPVLAACVTAPIRPGSYPIKPEQSVDLAPNISITYDSFSDSRCPPNVQCVWAGSLVFRFLLEGPAGTEEITLGPDRLEAAPKAMGGTKIALDPATIPPARAAGTARPGDVIAVTLKVIAPSSNLLPTLTSPRP